MNYCNFYELSAKEQEELKSLEDNEVEVALMEAGGDNTTKIIDSKVNLYNLMPEMYESINSVSQKAYEIVSEISCILHHLSFFCSSIYLITVASLICPTVETKYPLDHKTPHLA